MLTDRPLMGHGKPPGGSAWQVIRSGSSVLRDAKLAEAGHDSATICRNRRPTLSPAEWRNSTGFIAYERMPRGEPFRHGHCFLTSHWISMRFPDGSSNLYIDPV
jgi:hypothetical protein